MDLHNKKCPACGHGKLWHRMTEIKERGEAAPEGEKVILNTFSCLNESCRKVFTETYIPVYRGTEQTGQYSKQDAGKCIHLAE